MAATEVDRTLRNAQIIEAVRAGEKYAHIAARFGLNRSSISNIALKAGIKQVYRRRDIPLSLHDWYFDLLSRGWSAAEASRIILDHARVRKIAA